jgi:hypothetical protein
MAPVVFTATPISSWIQYFPFRIVFASVNTVCYMCMLSICATV